jgi:hypothetical protein
MSTKTKRHDEIQYEDNLPQYNFCFHFVIEVHQKR